MTTGAFSPVVLVGLAEAKKSDLSELSEEEVWEAMEGLIRQDLMSEDVMTRHRAMKSKVIKDEYLLKKRAEYEAESMTSPAKLEMQEIIKTSQYFGGLKGLKAMLKSCPGCAKFLGQPPRDFGFDKKDGDEG